LLLTSILLCLRFSSIGATRNVVFVVLDVCNIKHGQNEKVNCQKKNFSVVLKQAFYDDHFFFERFFLKLLWVKSKLLSRVVFLKPHIARPCVALHSFHPGDARCLQSNRSV